MNVEQIARICHEANRLYCEDRHHPASLPWSYAPEWEKTSLVDGVKAIMAAPHLSPEESHENWSRYKLADGWVFCPVKDADAKTHPCLVPYGELPADQRTKDVLFVNIVRALMPPPVRQRPANNKTTGPAAGIGTMSQQQEANHGKGHAENGRGATTQADGDGRKAPGEKGHGTSEEGRLKP